MFAKFLDSLRILRPIVNRNMKTGFRSIPRFLLPLSSLQPLKARHPPTFQCFNAVSRSRPSLQACLSARNPSTSQSRCLASDAKSQSSKKTVQQLAARNRSGPFSIRAALVFLVAGAGLTVYFRYERTRMERKRVAEATKGVGKPKIGGHFDLIDHNEEPFSDGDMKGGFSIVSHKSLFASFTQSHVKKFAIPSQGHRRALA